jgi:hypothetical protein
LSGKPFASQHQRLAVTDCDADRLGDLRSHVGVKHTTSGHYGNLGWRNAAVAWEALRKLAGMAKRHCLPTDSGYFRARVCFVARFFG